MLRRNKPVTVAIGMIFALAGVAFSSDIAVHKIRVLAVDSSTHQGLAGARVFVLAENGKELATATTDGSGRTTLPVSVRQDAPKYIFVDDPRHFISGIQWRSSAVEYYITAPVLEVK